MILYKYFYLQKVIIFSDHQLLQALRRGFCRAGADLDGEAAAAVQRDGAALQDGDRVGQAARGAGSARGVPHPARQQPPQVKVATKFHGTQDAKKALRAVITRQMILMMFTNIVQTLGEAVHKYPLIIIV